MIEVRDVNGIHVESIRRVRRELARSFVAVFGTSPGIEKRVGGVMQRLRGSDAFAIYSESSTSPFVTVKVGIYSPTDKNDVPGTSEIDRWVRAGIVTTGARNASLRIMRVPFDLHHPVWVVDPFFSPENHIHHAQLPSPGNKAQLCEFVSELMSQPLDPERPPWEIRVIEGLEGGRIAIVFKVHHALLDGRTFAKLIERTHSRNELDRAPEERVAGESIPRKSRLIGDALIDLARSYTVELPNYYRYLKRARESSSLLKAGRKAAEEFLAPLKAPFTILNEEGGRERVFQYETFPLAEIKTLSRRFDCTINTLVLTVCSEVLRRYLGEIDALPADPLITAMPVGDPGGEELKRLLNSDIHNNNLAVAFLPLYQNIINFTERLQEIKRASKAAINNVRLSNGRRIDNYLDFMPGTLVRLIKTSTERRQAKKLSPYANLVISNVPGPKERLYALGGRLQMEELVSCGNLMDGGNLNITVWSYHDKLTFSFYSRKGVLPEPNKIGSHLRQVIEELSGKLPADQEMAQA